VPSTPKHDEYALRVVKFSDLEDYITTAFDKKYDLRKGVGESRTPGDRIVFDFRESIPNVSEIMQITDWRDYDDEQPSARIMLNNLVVRGYLAYGIYMTIFPFQPEERR
jgi:hypothetical protein